MNGMTTKRTNTASAGRSISAGPSEYRFRVFDFRLRLGVAMSMAASSGSVTRPAHHQNDCHSSISLWSPRSAFAAIQAAARSLSRFCNSRSISRVMTRDLSLGGTAAWNLRAISSGMDTVTFIGPPVCSTRLLTRKSLTVGCSPPPRGGPPRRLRGLPLPL